MKNALTRCSYWLLTLGMVFAMAACTEEEKDADPVMVDGAGGADVMGAGGMAAPSGGTPAPMGGTPAAGGMVAPGGEMVPEPDPEPDPEPEPVQGEANEFLGEGFVRGQG